MPAATSKSGSVRGPSYILKDLDKTSEIGLFYGFQPVKTPKIEKVDIDQAADLVSNRSENLKVAFPRVEEKISLLRTFQTWNLQTDVQPVMLQYKRPVSQLSIRRTADESHHSLDMIGSFDSISEAIAIRTAIAILADHGHKNIIVDINSIGDKYSIIQFEKELINFTRKYGGDLSADIKLQLKKDPFDVWKIEDEKWREIREKAPQSLSFLSESGVEHFGRVLEYLETLDIPYRINNSLVGNRNYCSHTVFEIKSVPEKEGEAEETFAIGTRHNYLAKKVGFKQDTPMVSVNINFKKIAPVPKLFFKNKPQPKFFFIQFGTIAKLKSLSVIESLRQAQIPVHHQLSSDKFMGQLAAAETLKTPFVIIMGQKEAMENTAVVRHVSTRSQEVVLLPDLAHYLTRLNVA